MASFLHEATLVILVYYLILSIWYTLLLILSFPEVIKKFQEAIYGNIPRFINELALIPITIVTPAFNETSRIMAMLQSILNSDYKNVRCIIVNDGSTDGMIPFLMETLQLYEVPLIIKQTIPTYPIKHYYQSALFPNVSVLDKEHSPFNCGADSLNAGLNACQTPIMLTVDADTVLEPEALSRMLFTFLAKQHCVVVSGSIYVLNENILENGRLLTTRLPRKFVSAVQSLEYLRSFLYGRAGLNVIGGAMCYPGAFTLFETHCLREMGGFDQENFAYDAEIITKLHHFMRKNRYPYNINHSPNAFSWTEVPATAKSFWSQRDKWHRGMWRSSLRHIIMFMNPRYGIIGLLGFPTYILFEILGPVIEFISYFLFIIAYLIGAINATVLCWFLILAWGFLAYVTVAMIFLNRITFNKYNKTRDSFRAILLTFLEMTWFRQFRAACCFRATIRYFFFRLQGRPL